LENQQLGSKGEGLGVFEALNGRLLCIYYIILGSLLLDSCREVVNGS
jgi:hypothetical protein